MFGYSPHAFHYFKFPLETICMKSQNLFSEKNKKNILKHQRLKILPNILSVKPSYPCYITELHNDVCSLLRCCFTEDHALYPLGETIEQCYRPLQLRVVLQRRRHCIALEICKLLREKNTISIISSVLLIYFGKTFFIPRFSLTVKL